MLNIMIVDDEPIVRLSLKSLNNWKNFGFSCIHEAANGHQALELLHKNSDIDIVVTDIKMPVMDGLSLIRHIKEEDLDVKLIILSAYDDFYLVRDAFKLGVEDYIIKTEMEPAAVLTVLQNVARRMNRKELEPACKLEISQASLDKEQLLKNLLAGTISTVDQHTFLHELQLDSNAIMLCVLLVDDFSKIQERYKSSPISDFSKLLTNGIIQVLAKRNSGEIVCMSPDFYTLILTIQENDEKTIRSDVDSLLDKICRFLNDYLNVRVTIGVSSHRFCVDHIPMLLKEAEQCAAYGQIVGKLVVYPDMISAMSFSSKHPESVRLRNVFTMIENNQYSQAHSELKKVFLSLHRYTISDNAFLHDLYMKIFLSIVIIAEEKGFAPEEILEYSHSITEKIREFGAGAELGLWFKSSCITIIDFLGKNSITVHSRALVKTIKYLRGNIKNPDITVQGLSKRVQLSSCYFSHLFAKETGMTVKQYITQMRMEEAKKLLSTTNMMIYEVAYEVGYQTVEHFSRVFKREIGISPSVFMHES